MIAGLFTAVRERIAAHLRYRRMVAEIASMTQADLIEIGAFQVDLYRAARQEIYG